MVRDYSRKYKLEGDRKLWPSLTSRSTLDTVFQEGEMREKQMYALCQTETKIQFGEQGPIQIYSDETFLHEKS